MTPSFRLLLITDRRVTEDLVATVTAALTGAPEGAVAVMLREKDLPGRALLALARRLRAVTAEAGAALLVNDRVDVALEAGADGVHLPAAGIPVAEARRRLGPERLDWRVHPRLRRDRSRHRSRRRLRHLRPGLRHPEQAPLRPGARASRRWPPPPGAPCPSTASAASIAGNADAVLAAGAAGVACIRAVLAAPAAAAAARALLAASPRAAAVPPGAAREHPHRRPAVPRGAGRRPRPAPLHGRPPRRGPPLYRRPTSRRSSW